MLLTITCMTPVSSVSCCTLVNAEHGMWGSQVTCGHRLRVYAGFNKSNLRLFKMQFNTSILYLQGGGDMREKLSKFKYILEKLSQHQSF